MKISEKYLPALESKHRFLVLYGGAGCYPSDTEFLTPSGWKRISEYKKGDLVLQVDKRLNASFVKPNDFIVAPVDKFINIKNTRVDFTTSLFHKHLVVSEKNRVYEIKTIDLLEKHNKNKRGNKVSFFSTFSYVGSGLDYNNNYIRLKIAVLADGHFLNKIKPVCRMNIKKDRKKQRLRELLKLNNIEFKETKKDNGYSVFSFLMDNKEKEFNSYWFAANREQLEIICDEVLKWDGSIVKRQNRVEHLSFSTTSKKSADFIQFAFSAIGYRATIREDIRECRTTCYYVDISKHHTRVGIGKDERHNQTTKFTEIKSSDGLMYCFTVPTGFFIVRQKGKIYISGNSGKSVFATQKIITRVLTETNHRILVIRKVGATLRNSVWDLFNDIIHKEDLQDYFEFNKSNFEITCLLNGNKILCKGLDNPEKIKSIAGITSIWIEEATELKKEDLDQLDLRLRGKTQNYKQIMITFNPVSATHWIKKTFFDYPVENMFVLKTTYLDNPFLDEEYKEAFKRLKRDNLNYYKIYALGEWGSLDGLIYADYKTIDELPEFYEDEFVGLDFGYNHPYSIVKVRINKRDLYIDEIFYKTEWENEKVIEYIDREHPEIKDIKIWADSARPDLITGWENAGYNISKANKSVFTGINAVKSFNLHITKRSINILKEIGLYAWKKDRSGNTLEEPIKMNDDAMDAIRYAITPFIEKKPKVKTMILKGL